MTRFDMPKFHHAGDFDMIWKKLASIERLAGYNIMRKVSDEYSNKYIFLKRSLIIDPKRIGRVARLKCNDYLDTMHRIVLEKYVD